MLIFCDRPYIVSNGYTQNSVVRQIYLFKLHLTQLPSFFCEHFLRAQYGYLGLNIQAYPTCDVLCTCMQYNNQIPVYSFNSNCKAIRVRLYLQSFLMLQLTIAVGTHCLLLIFSYLLVVFLTLLCLVNKLSDSKHCKT